MAKKKSLIDRFVRPLAQLFRKKKSVRKGKAEKLIQRRKHRSVPRSKKKKTVSALRRRPAKKSAKTKPAKKKALPGKKISRRKTPKRKLVSGQGKKKTSTQAKRKSVKTKVEKPLPSPPGIVVGEVTHFFSKIQVVVVKIFRGDLRVGDRIMIKGKASEFTQSVESLQIESVDVKSARRGQLVGLKVKKPAKPGDQVIRFS